MVRFLMICLLFVAAGCHAATAPSEFELISECFAAAEADDTCLDAWNTLISKADPGLRAAMLEYEGCIESAGLSEFSDQGCRAEAKTLLAHFPG